MARPKQLWFDQSQLKADLSEATAVSIRQLREALELQRMLRKARRDAFLVGRKRREVKDVKAS